MKSSPASEIGFVRSVHDFLIHIDGFPSVKINEVVENEQGVRGWVNALLENKVEVLLLDEGSVQPGQVFKRNGQKLTVAVGDFLMGRAINPLGIPIDGKGLLAKTKTTPLLELDQPAPGISAREFITKQFDTGTILIDSLIPLGKGQRELFLGDARSGKTELLVNIILNQKYTNTICIFASIGKPVAEVRNIIDVLSSNRALVHTVVIATSSSDPAPLIYLTPQTAFTVAEYFQRLGKDVLVVLDDIGNHAKIYREISLLGDRSPGRESYPGDIFYQHAHLLERAGNFKKEAGGGSITALPVMELNLNDFTTLIPTNLMGMTDGHTLFKSSLHLQGWRPAIDISLSVTRVGNQTQHHIQNKLAVRVKQILTQAAQLETVSRFGAELPFSTQLILRQKDQISEFLKQPSLGYVPKEIQSILLALPFTPFMMKSAEKDFVLRYKEKLIQIFTSDKDLSKITKEVFNLKSDDELINLLETNSGKIQQLLFPEKAVQKAQGTLSPTPPLPKSAEKKKSFIDKIEDAILKK